MQELPAFRSARTDYDTTQPQLSVRIDREAATKLGVPIATITSLINTMIDYQKAADLFIGNDIVEIQVKAGGRPINDPSDLNNLFVKAADGKFITLSSLVTIKEVAIAPTLGREDRQRSVGITADLNRGRRARRRGPADASRGEIGARAEHVDHAAGRGQDACRDDAEHGLRLRHRAADRLPGPGGAVRKRDSALVILFTVPFGLAAAALAIKLTGGTMNVYSQIGLVLLVGVMAKNGILIVEFANIRRDEGADVDSAIREAAARVSGPSR